MSTDDASPTEMQAFESPEQAEAYVDVALKGLHAGLAGSWDESQRLQVKAEGMLEHLGDADRRRLGVLGDWMQCTTDCLRFGLSARSEAELTHVLGLVEKTESVAERLRRDEPQIRASLPPGFDLSLQLQRLGIMARLAALAGDQDRVASLKQQQASVQNRLLATLPDADPWKLFMKANEAFASSVASFGMGCKATDELDLASAQTFLAKAAADLAENDDLLRRAGEAPGFLKPLLSAIAALRELMLAVHVYTDVFGSIITGQVTREHAAALDSVVHRTRLGMQMLRDAKFESVDVGSMDRFADLLVTRCLNLKAIIERSGSASSTHLRLAPRVVAFFLLTFVVTMATFRLTGLVKEVGVSMLVACAVISVIVSVIATFAMDANRFIPLFKAVGLSLNSSKSKEEKT